jgi:hypothetical protein
MCQWYQETPSLTGLCRAVGPRPQTGCSPGRHLFVCRRRGSVIVGVRLTVLLTVAPDVMKAALLLWRRMH